MEEVAKALSVSTGDPNGSTYQNLRKLNAKLLLEAGKYNDATLNLVECIGSSCRTMARFRYERTLCESDQEKSLRVCSKKINSLLDGAPVDNSEDPFLSYISEENKKYATKVQMLNKTVSSVHCDKFIGIDHVKHLDDDHIAMNKMKKMLKEIPNEWSLIQLTANYEPNNQWDTLKTVKSKVNSIFVTVLSNDNLKQQNIEPFTVEIVPKPLNSLESEKPLFEELHLTLQENLNVIENNSRITNNSLAKYWEKRDECDLRMKSIISNMNMKWLGPWRCLILGQINSPALRKSVYSHVNIICEKNKFKVSPVQKFLLCSLLGAAYYISMPEISILLHRIQIDYTKQCEQFNCKMCQSKRQFNNMCIKCDIRNIINTAEYQLFKEKFKLSAECVKSGTELVGLLNTPRSPLVLLIDEKLDTFPWEMLPMLTNNPVTRIECLSFAYGLLKKHKEKMINGYFQLCPNIGNFLINPGGDLIKMEKRMSSFIQYWCPKWKGEKNMKPPPDLYENYLQNSDVFLYCGHGDGSHYIGGGAERLAGLKSLAILSGCGSVALHQPGPRILPVPLHSHFHMANCPSIVGMLWEVTDLEVDKVTSMLIGLFIPSEARPHWGNVDKTRWTAGTIDPRKSNGEKELEMEPDLLKALARARSSTDYVMISASIVSRGLPIMIEPN